MDSEEQPYYVVKLKTPISVRCSVDAEILPYETDEVYLRKSALESDSWTPVDPEHPEDGFYMPNWVVDFSKGQQIAIYQETSIKKWAQLNRGDRRIQNRDRINDSIREKIANKKKD